MSDEYLGQERRSATRFDVKSEILSSIAKTEDHTVKSLLLIMLGVLEEIGNKIDNVISDEKALRETVLNGHAGVHPKHHEWIAAQIKKEERSEGRKEKIGDGLVEKIIWVALTAIVTYVWFK